MSEVEEIIRRNENQFLEIPDYPFLPNFIDVGNVNIHYVDVGKKNSEVILLLHGEPSWSFLYRKMIPIFEKAGFRVIAPDLIGFGKSDKFTNKSAYSYTNHQNWLNTFIKKMDLQKITLFCQDWGGLIGLRVAIDQKERFSKIIAANTALPTGEFPMSHEFMQWLKFSQTIKNFQIGRIIQSGCVNKLSKEEKNAYDAPFPNESFKAGARVFPTFVPINSNDVEGKKNREYWKEWEKWENPFLCLFSDLDPYTKKADILFRRKIPGCKGQAHKTIHNAGHFLQEDKPEELANVTLEFMKK